MQPSKKRGTILVDSSVLIPLLGQSHSPFLPSEKKGGDEAARFFDALIQLAEHGYKVVIPAMVAYKSARIMPSGKPINQYFIDGYVFPVFQERHTSLGPIKNGKVANVSIAMPLAHTGDPADHYSDADLFIDHAKNAEQRFNDTPNDRGIRSLFMDLEKRNLKDFGDIAAQDWIRRVKPDHADLPVFYFTNNREALDHFQTIAEQRKIPYGILNLRGFYNALNRHGLFADIGLKNDWSAREVTEKIYRLGGYDSERNDFALIDTNHTYFHANFPFCNSLAGVKEEIEAAKSAPSPQPGFEHAAPEQPPAPSPSPLDKFHNRYGDWKARCLKTNAEKLRPTRSQPSPR